MAYDSDAAYADNNLHDHFLVIQFGQLLKQHLFSNAKDSDGAYVVCCFASLSNCAKCSVPELSRAESKRAKQMLNRRSTKIGAKRDYQEARTNCSVSYQ